MSSVKSSIKTQADQIRWLYATMRAHKDFNTDKSITVTAADKHSATLILNRINYEIIRWGKVLKIIPRSFAKNIPKSLMIISNLSNEEKSLLTVYDCKIPKLYGLPKNSLK